MYDALVDRDPETEGDLPEQVRRNLPGNGLRLVTANALQASGDQVANASTVLPWLFHVLGVPAGLTGLLAPIRESGSMLPQALLTPVVLRVRRRALVFVAGALVQAAGVATMAVTAAVGSGLGAGIVVLVALAVFSLGRSLCSISSKDVQGRTVPKGERGQINGLSTTASGIVAITLGLGLRVLADGDVTAGQLGWLLAAGAALWVLAAATYLRIREPLPPAPEPEERDAQPGWLTTAAALLRDDAPFRRFVGVRSLLLVSSLSPPFLVTLAVQSGAGALSGLGGFIIASGLSRLVGGPLFGRLADRSSRTLMASGAAVASAVILLVVVLGPVLEDEAAWGTALFVGSYFLVTLVHTGVRMGRKTYVVDMAEGDRRTQYVAVSNSAMGLVLLVVGAVSALLATWAVVWALVFLAALGVLGVVASLRLPDVSAG